MPNKMVEYRKAREAKRALRAEYEPQVNEMGFDLFLSISSVGRQYALVAEIKPKSDKHVPEETVKSIFPESYNGYSLDVRSFGVYGEFPSVLGAFGLRENDGRRTGTPPKNK